MDGSDPSFALPDSLAVSGGIIPGGGVPAWHAWGGEECKLPVVIAAPHGGRDYTPALLASMRDPATACLRLEDRHVDTLARVVAAQTGAPLLIAAAPRAMIDLNRAPDDVDWSMISGGRPTSVRHSLANRRARSGLGLVPRRLPGFGEIWRRPLSSVDLEERVGTIHRTYHQTLGELVERLRDRWGAALLLDLHSMPPLRARHQDDPAAQFVVGDRFGVSCDAHLSAAALRSLASSGRPVAHNRPYSGGYVLDRHGAPLRGLHAMQIEVCRSIYLDGRLDQPSARLPSVAAILARLVRSLADEVVALGRGGQLPQAAE